MAVTEKTEDKRRKELADFLKTRRARLTPTQAGLPDGGRRRTPGLRREEVAMLASVSTVWYTWLEQERDVRPSAQVLDSVAGALRLDPDEKAHLFALADQGSYYPLVSREEVVSPALRRALDALNPNPAYVMGRRWDKLAWNDAMTLVFGDLGSLPTKERNTLWSMFTNQMMRQTIPDWESHARHVLAQFRASWGRHAGDPDFVELIEDLKEASAEFREWWPIHDVQGSPEGYKEVDHPRVGRLVFEHTTFQLHDDPDLKMVLFTPMPDTGTTEVDTAEKLQSLFACPRAARPAVEGSPSEVVV